MSRYDWPSTGRPSPDRQPQRRAFLQARRGPFDAEAHERALAQRRALEIQAAEREGVAPTDNADLWVPAGPSTVLRGQTDDRLRVAGRVRDLAISSDGQRAYAGTANGGVWYSGDAGASWMPVGAWAATRDRSQTTSPSQTLTCGCLLVTAWGDEHGTGDAVLVGTGELDTESGAVPGGKLGGVGVLVATSPVPTAIADPLGNPWTREAKNLQGLGVYRLAADPADATHVVAATSRGLYARHLPAAADSDWDRVTVAPFDAPGATDDKPLIVTDVLWRGGRLWAAVQDRRDGYAASGLWYSDNGVAGPFTYVALPGLQSWARLGLAASDADANVLYVLGRGPALWRVDGTTAHAVTNVPPDLFGATHDQSYYDLAIAVDPVDAARVILGGSTVQTAAQDWVASLFDCHVTGAAPSYSLSYSTPAGGTAAKDATFIGTDVHADVHAVRWSRTDAPAFARDVWVGCDGGVFRSQSDGARGTFVPRNTGIAALETGYVASHPANDALMLAGTQDNGVLRRVGDTVWEAVFLGDGGGVAFNPQTPTRYIGQYTQGTWYDENYRSLPIVKRTAGNVANTQSETDEMRAASWYSNPAVRRTGGGTVRLAVGTHRIWYSEDWGATWVTLPGGHDPRAGGAQDTDTDAPFDAHGGQAGDATVIALRWLDDDTLLALSQGAVYTLKPDDDHPPRWERTVIDRWDRPKCSTPSAGDYPSPSGHLPPFGAWSDLAVHDAARGDHGSFYVATTASTDGHGHDAETLWWFDGDSHWWATGLRDDASGVPAPAYAVVVHPHDANVVYVGTSVGVWKGLLDVDDTQDPPRPSWDWFIYANGLPEATVQDLSICEVGSALLLRAALQARGVWEVDLAAPQPPWTFVRVHAFDARRQPMTALDNPGPGAAFDWHASPDVRVRPAPHAAAPAPSSLPIAAAPIGPSAIFDLWTFQTALHAVDPLCVADGQWTAGFAARLAAKRTELALASPVAVDRAVWDAVVVGADNAYVEPWTGEPTEADLYELIRELGAPGSPMPTGLRAVHAKVDVLVHHRHYAALPVGQVAVTLLRLPIAPADGDGAAVVEAWGDGINGVLAAGAVSGGFSLPGGWSFADGANPVRRPTSPVEPRMPRVVTFDVDFTSASVADRFLLVAVVHSTPDPADLLTSTDIRNLVLTDRHVAARGIEIVA